MGKKYKLVKEFYWLTSDNPDYSQNIKLNGKVGEKYTIEIYNVYENYPEELYDILYFESMIASQLAYQYIMDNKGAPSKVVLQEYWSTNS